MHENAKFWNRMSKRYAKMQVSDETSYQEKLARTRAVFPDGARVLEIGCGTGSTALAHAPYAAHILATDFAPAMISIAEGKAAAAGVTNVTFRTATLEEITPEDGPFDAVLALNVVHLLSDPEPAIHQMARHLKPGGVLVLSTACLTDKMSWMRPIAFVLKLVKVFPVVTFFSRADLERWISAADLTIEDSWRPNGFGKAVFHIARKAAQTEV